MEILEGVILTTASRKGGSEVINTPAFESLERYIRLSKALEYIKNNPAYVYQWMEGPLHEAIEREYNFAFKNKIFWEREVAK